MIRCASAILAAGASLTGDALGGIGDHFAKVVGHINEPIRIDPAGSGNFADITVNVNRSLYYDRIVV